jgi:flagellar biosynthetic protein FliR
MFGNPDIKILSEYIPNFLFIFLRSSIFISLLPVIGSKQLPAQFRIGLAFFISIMLTPVVKFDISEDHIPVIIVKELLIAIALGLTVRFIFMAVNMAGMFVSHTMGMSIARVFNPEVGQTTHIAEAYGIMAMLFFLTMDAHHDLIYIFVKSFELLPAGELNIKPLVPEILKMGSGFFALAIKIAAPVIVGLLIAHLLTGFLYKAAPQMNIFFIALPLNIFLGFLLVMLSIPVFEHVLGINFSNMRNELVRVIMIARG